MKTYFDIFAIEPKLTWEGRKVYATKTGSFFGFIACLFMVVATIYFSRDFLSNSNPQITYNTSYNYTQKLNFQNIPFMLMLQTPLYTPLKNEKRLYTVGGYMIKQLRINETYIDNFTEEIFFEYCNISKHFGNYTALFQNIPYLENHFCPIPGQNMTVFGSSVKSDSDFALMGLFVNRCQNSTKKKDCLPAEQVNSGLQNVFPHFVTLSYFIDHTNYTSPGQVYTYIGVSSMSTNLFKRGDITLKNTDYVSDNGWLFENKILQPYYTIGDAIYSVDIKPEGLYPGSFGALNFKFGNFKDSYNRNYIKLQFVIANIGGIMKSILFISQIFSNYFAEFLYNLELVNSVLNYNSGSYQQGNLPNNIISIEKNDKSKFGSSQIHLNPILKKNSFSLDLNRLNVQTKVGAGKESGLENSK
jgi:hypothetical protein